MLPNNQVILTGNLGGDPELHKKSEESSGLVSFTVAENVSRLNEKTGAYEQTHTNWFPVKAFGSLGARVKAALKKGDRVTVYGRLRTYRYETEGGGSQGGFEVLADDVCLSSLLPRARREDTAQGGNG
jgi:single stranded DNA-binding protein